MNDRVAVLDATALDALREMVGEEFVGELIATFLADAPPLLVSLRAAVERGDADEARRAAHTLKSNGATFGATDLAALCQELENQAKNEGLADAGALTGQVEEEYARVEAALVALKDGGAA